MKLRDSRGIPVHKTLAQGCLSGTNLAVSRPFFHKLEKHLHVQFKYMKNYKIIEKIRITTFLSNPTELYCWIYKIIVLKNILIGKNLFYRKIPISNIFSRRKTIWPVVYFIRNNINFKTIQVVPQILNFTTKICKR